MKHYRKGEEHHNQHGENLGFCVCPQCGYSEKHQAGFPCRNTECPQCNIPLIRSITQNKKNEIPAEKNKNEISENSIKKIYFPKVVPEKCTSCGKCIQICPTKTIVLVNNKAFVITAGCKNCKVCVKICPEDAFILD
jgi:Pyruvate/2-oxoacid:ferredoxin oxidoreductase delta subunit